MSPSGHVDGRRTRGGPTSTRGGAGARSGTPANVTQTDGGDPLLINFLVVYTPEKQGGRQSLLRSPPIQGSKERDHFVIPPVPTWGHKAKLLLKLCVTLIVNSMLEVEPCSGHHGLAASKNGRPNHTLEVRTKKMRRKYLADRAREPRLLLNANRKS